MCEVLGVSTSGYYHWKKELKGCLKTSDLDTQIKDIFEGSRSSYGSPRVFKALHELVFQPVDTQRINYY